MEFTRFKNLPPYPFPRLRALLQGITPKDESAALNMSVGEPQHAAPGFVTGILHRERHSYNRYPPVQGTNEWQTAVAGWLTRRNNLPQGMVSGDHLVPLCGSREGLFSLGLVVINRRKADETPLVLSPNPFYQPYAGAASAAGAETRYVAGSPALNQMPDYGALPEDILRRAALAFICNPSNPEGALAGREYLKRMIRLARKYDFILVGDECYSEIYDDRPPVGLLDVCHQLAAEDEAGEMTGENRGSHNPFRNVVVFNSLSKRSSLAGLRSGFMAGDPAVVAATRAMRSYGGAPLPLPVQAASAAAWNDEGHVVGNRALYRQKFDLAEKYLAGRFSFRRPAGGFCLWLDVGDGEEACRKLWREAGIRGLPGAYLARPQADGHNPGAPYIRLVLVHDAELLEPALEKIAITL